MDLQVLFLKVYKQTGKIFKMYHKIGYGRITCYHCIFVAREINPICINIFFKWPQLAELKLISQLYYKISPKTAKYKLDEYFYFEIA